jgi:hypothetical protein
MLARGGRDWEMGDKSGLLLIRSCAGVQVTNGLVCCHQGPITLNLYETRLPFRLLQLATRCRTPSTPSSLSLSPCHPCPAEVQVESIFVLATLPHRPCRLTDIAWSVPTATHPLPTCYMRSISAAALGTWATATAFFPRYRRVW